MGYGTGLLCTQFNGMQRLFGLNDKDDPYCVIFKDDCSDLIFKAEKITKDIEFTRRMTTKAREVIEERHLHTHRLVELKNILTALVEGHEVPKVWGQ
jgi:hypothetical protein